MTKEFVQVSNSPFNLINGVFFLSINYMQNNLSIFIFLWLFKFISDLKFLATIKLL